MISTGFLQLFFYILIHLFNKFQLKLQNVTGTLLGLRDVKRDKTYRVCHLFYILVGGDRSQIDKQLSIYMESKVVVNINEEM